MPVTPFHFGLGLVAKGAVPRGFCLSAFVVLQGVIDLESLYNLTYQRYPTHAFLHTLVGATLLAVGCSVCVGAVVLGWRALRRRHPGAPAIAGKWVYILPITALLATWSHVGLDALVHQDVSPFWPLVRGSPLIGVVDVNHVEPACVALAVVSAVLIAVRAAVHARKQ
jgi:membrane-bound metal-dependent hydrolase YbcI (DUF457 family)